MNKWINMLNRLMDEATDGTDVGAGGGSEPNTDTPIEATADAGESGESSDDKPEDGDVDGSDDANGAPESYVDFDLPDGMTINAEMLEAFTPVFKDMGLTQEQAQGLVNVQAEQVKAQQQAQYDAFSQQLNEWGNSAKNDKEYGGDKFDESIGLATQAIDKLGTPELKQALDDSGMGNHPEMVRLMVRIGKLMGEDTAVGGSNAAAKSDRTSILYPNS